jgi:4-carboxymuconolactone decarboxylase
MLLKERNMSIRIPLPDIDSLPSDIKETIQAAPSNVGLMIANAPASFKSWSEFAISILFQSNFDPRKREIAVLRVAHVTRSRYEWTHHVTLAKAYGLTEDVIRTIATEDPVTSLGEEGNLLCRVADEISYDVRLSDEALSLILDRYGVRSATELILCISYFNFLSRFLESTGVELEERSGR